MHAVEPFEHIIESVKDRFAGEGYEFPASFLTIAFGPIVYVLISDNEAIYVGSSAFGLERPGKRSHQEAHRAKLEANRVCIYPCVDEQAARDVESALIFVLKPKYNYQDQMGKDYMAKWLGMTEGGYRLVYSGVLRGGL